MSNQKSLLHLRAIFQIFVIAISLLLLSFAKVEARQNISELEDLELERQLKLLNKPAMKTIKTNDGDIFDCVGFYKQPAFDHPLLQNHNFKPEMKATLSKKSKEDAMASSYERFSKIELEGGGCPGGTVPIKRITKKDLIRQRHLQAMDENHNSYSNNINNSKASASNGGYDPTGLFQYAETRIFDNNLNYLIGGGMITTIYAPKVQKRQFSGGRVRLQGSSDSVEVGWIVHPTLYGDIRPRLYAKFEAGKSGCFNTLCPGFVQVNMGIPLGLPLLPSRIGGPIMSHVMYVEQDKANGNWWIMVGQNYTQIGFWPQRIFTTLQDYAPGARYGGVVYSPPGLPKPQMGSGIFPNKDFLKNAYCRKCNYIWNDQKTYSLDHYAAYGSETNDDLYRVQDFANQGFAIGHLVVYGGPGNSH